MLRHACWRRAFPRKTLDGHLQCFADHATSPCTQCLEPVKSVVSQKALPIAMAIIFSICVCIDCFQASRGIPCMTRVLHHHHGLCALLTAYDTACVQSQALTKMRKLHAIVSHEPTSSAKNARNRKDIRNWCIKS